MVRIDIEVIRAGELERNRFNRLDLNNIEFFENDKPIVIEKDVLEDWQFVGLSNTDFIMTDTYKDGLPWIGDDV